MRNNVIRCTALFMFLLALTFVCVPASAAQATYVIRLGHPSTTAGGLHEAALSFQQEVQERSGGRVEVQIFPGNQLGNEREMAESVQLGTQEMLITNCSPFGNFVPAVQVMDMPFIFETNEQVYAALDGALGDALIDAGRAVGFEIFGVGEIGFMIIANSVHPIRNVNDIKGLKIRTQETPALLDTYRLLGADPTPVPINEVYTALQTGVVNGTTFGMEPFINNRIYEVQRYLSVANVAYSAAAIVANLEWYNSLPADIQEIIRTAARNWVPLTRNKMQEVIRKDMPTVEEYSILTLSEEIDIQSFRDAVAPIFEKYPHLSRYVEIARSYVK